MKSTRPSSTCFQIAKSSIKRVKKVPDRSSLLKPSVAVRSLSSSGMETILLQILSCLSQSQFQMAIKGRLRKYLRLFMNFKHHRRFVFKTKCLRWAPKLNCTSKNTSKNDNVCVLCHCINLERGAAY